MALEDTLREVRADISRAQGAAARSQVELENAQASLADARKTLKDEYGVETPEEARRVLDELQGELDAEIESARQALRAASE